MGRSLGVRGGVLGASPPLEKLGRLTTPPDERELPPAPGANTGLAPRPAIAFPPLLPWAVPPARSGGGGTTPPSRSPPKVIAGAEALPRLPPCASTGGGTTSFLPPPNIDPAIPQISCARLVLLGGGWTTVGGGSDSFACSCDSRTGALTGGGTTFSLISGSFTFSRAIPVGPG